jgi:dipeptidyl aminopeptidase/acylaminoacyl peptidase
LPALADRKNVMHVEFTDYYDLVGVCDADLAPDDETVAFVRTEPDDDESSESTVYVTGPDQEPRRFTRSAGNDAEPCWSPSGDRLAFTSASDDGSALWLLPADGGEARRVTDVVGDVANLAWAPDGTRIAFTQEVRAEERDAGHDLDCEEEYEREAPDPRVVDRNVYRQHGGYRDGKRQHVYLVDLATDELRRVTDGDFDHANPEWGDATTLYYTARRDGDPNDPTAPDPDDSLVHDIVAHDTESDTAETVTQTTGWLPAFSATADGRIAFREGDLEPPGPSMRTTDAVVFDRESGDRRNLTAEFHRRVYRGTRPEWGPDGESLYFLAPDEGTVDLYRVPADGSGEPEPVVEDAGHVTEFALGEETVATVRSEWDHPGDAFLHDLDGGDERRLTRVNESYLDDRSVAEPEAFWFTSADGTPVQGWLLTPPDGAASEPYPLVTQVHGGPTIMWSESGSMWHEFQSLAARGYAVFWCNPRGSSGYGEVFSTAIAEDWGALDSADVLAGVDEVCDRPAVDDGNVFVTGGSFGGFLTAWLLGNSDAFDAGVAQRGVYDQVGQFGTTDTYHSSEKQLGLPWEAHEEYWESSPIAYADRITAPTLLLHSENDYRVPIANAETLYRFLKKSGVTTQFVRYPREGHELSRSGEPDHVVDRLERIGAWFDGYSDHHDAEPVVPEGGAVREDASRGE